MMRRRGPLPQPPSPTLASALGFLAVWLTITMLLPGGIAQLQRMLAGALATVSWGRGRPQPLVDVMVVAWTGLAAVLVLLATLRWGGQIISSGWLWTPHADRRSTAWPSVAKRTLPTWHPVRLAQASLAVGRWISVWILTVWFLDKQILAGFTGTARSTMTWCWGDAVQRFGLLAGLTVLFWGALEFALGRWFQRWTWKEHESQGRDERPDRPRTTFAPRGQRTAVFNRTDPHPHSQAARHVPSATAADRIKPVRGYDGGDRP